MITVEKLKIKANNLFPKLISSLLQGTEVFPFVLPGNKDFEGKNYSDWKAVIGPLTENTKEVLGKGYRIDWRQKRIGGILQKVPAKIIVDSLEDYLYLTNRSIDYVSVTTDHKTITDAFPSLQDWATRNIAQLLEYRDKWPDIIKVLHYFVANPDNSHLYLRELPIDVHSKFIEQHAGIIKRLLDFVLPENYIDKNINDFSLRYKLRKAGVYTQIRILDDTFRSTLGYDECALTIDDASFLKWVPKKVFIIENQSCFLSFPKFPDSVAIFGEGFKSRLTRHFNWLEQTDLYCWFDLDAPGFEMLNMIRATYPHAQNFLMDTITFEIFKSFSVDVSFRSKSLPNLTVSENKLYRYCIDAGKRLEQEKITHKFVLEKLKEL